MATNQLNLSIFKPLWLAEQQVLTPDELAATVLFTPAITEVTTATFKLTLLPERVQLALSRLEDESANARLIQRIVGGVLRALPHTPVNALGFNLESLIEPERQEDFAKWNRDEFASASASVVAGEVDTARYGSYVSMDVLQFRLRLTLSPFSISPHSDTPHRGAVVPSQFRMLAQFNYQKDFDGLDAAQRALASLDSWPSVIEHGRRVLSRLTVKPQ